MKPDYRTATDELVVRGVSLDELATELGVSKQSVKQARMDPASPSYRSPPPGWEKAVARLIRRHCGPLVDMADVLDP